MPFVKVESVGNDFILIHGPGKWSETKAPSEAPPNENALGKAVSEPGVLSEEDYPLFAIQASDRHKGVGSDGLLVLDMAGEKLILRMFNPDGTEDFCGNGLRCAARYAHEMKWTGTETVIEHHGRDVRVQILPNGEIRSQFHPSDFTPTVVPVCADEEVFLTPFKVLGRDLLISSLSTGSTHTVILAEELPIDAEFLELGPAIERHPIFPERTSVIWARGDGPHDLYLRIWERGVGETLGCGTGSAAAASVFFRARGEHGNVSVHNPGGTVTVNMLDWDSPITTEATAEVVYRGSIAFVPPNAEKGTLQG